MRKVKGKTQVQNPNLTPVCVVAQTLSGFSEPLGLCWTLQACQGRTFSLSIFITELRGLLAVTSSRVFAHLYRDEVVGMVLVDSIPPAEWENPTREQMTMVQVGLRYAGIATWLARFGVVRLCLARVAKGSPRLGRAAASAFGARVSSTVERISGEIRKLPAPIVPIVRGFWSEPKNFISLGQNVAALSVSAAQAAAMKSFGDLPLVVLSGDHHPAPYADWQRDLAQLSSRGVQFLAGDCGHWIHLDRPELVTEATCQVVAAARHNPETNSSPQTVKQ